MYLRQTALLEQQTGEESRRVATERDRLEAEVTARTLQLKELAQHLQTIREDERSHLARELHDELGALLTAAKLDVARLKSRLGAASREALERLAHLNETLNGGIALKRRIIEDLRPSSLSNLGLVAALEILLREFSARSEIPIEARLERVELEPAAQLTVYRLVQEALTNIAKYAKASHVVVTLEPHGDDAVRVAVQDDGVGFDDSVRASPRTACIGMRYRVEADGGEMRLRSTPGQGTLIEATLPAMPEVAVAEPCEASEAARGEPRRNRLTWSGAPCGPRPTALESLSRQVPARATYRSRRRRMHTAVVRFVPIAGPEPPAPITDQGHSMNTVSSTTKPLAQQGQDLADKAASNAQGAIRTTQKAADGALDNLSSKVDDLRDQAAPLLSRVSSQAEAAARRGIEAVRDTSQQLRDRALRVSDTAVGYVKDEPIKAMLIAAATGALLMGIVALMSRSRD